MLPVRTNQQEVQVKKAYRDEYGRVGRVELCQWHTDRVCDVEKGHGGCCVDGSHCSFMMLGVRIEVFEMIGVGDELLLRLFRLLYMELVYRLVLMPKCELFLGGINEDLYMNGAVESFNLLDRYSCNVRKFIGRPELYRTEYLAMVSTLPAQNRMSNKLQIVQ